MAHHYNWPGEKTGGGLGTCRHCGVTLRFERRGPRGGLKRVWTTPGGRVFHQGRAALENEPPCTVKHR
jgi:hypothetical protein